MGGWEDKYECKIFKELKSIYFNFCEIGSKTLCVKKNEETSSEFYQKVIFLSLQNISLGGNNRFMKSAATILLIHYFLQSTETLHFYYGMVWSVFNCFWAGILHYDA